MINALVAGRRDWIALAQVARSSMRIEIRALREALVGRYQ